MAIGTRSTNDWDTVNKSVRDEKLIRALISELESDEEAERLLERSEDANVVKASVRYELLHPYNGDKFINYLTVGDEVTARTKVEVQYSGQIELYEGNISQDATNIFDPEALID